MSEIVNCPHCGHPVQINVRAKVPTWAEPSPGSSTVRTLAFNTLARYGVELSDTRHMTDAELLELPNFGRKALAFVRSEAARAAITSDA